MAALTIESLLVRNPEHRITGSHTEIRTDGLAGCIAIGGIMYSSEGTKLFMSHKPRYEHQAQIAALESLGLRNGEGRMFFFPQSIRTTKGIHVVCPDGGKPLNYADAADKLEDTVRKSFPNFHVDRLLYADSKFPAHWSHAGINLQERRAYTDSGSIQF